MENKENVKDNNPTNKHEKKANEKCNYIYFIVTHEKGKKFKISLPNEYGGKGSLEKIKETEIKKEQTFYSSNVYRFKIIPDSIKKDEEVQNYEISISVEDEEDGRKNEYIIKFTDETKDFYEYDFCIEELDIIPLNHQEEFDIYIDILRNLYKIKMNSIENDNLILSTHRLFDKANQKFNFSFYILIFLECFRGKILKTHLLKFKPENISELGTFKEDKLKQNKTILNLLSKNPFTSLNIQNEKDEEELLEIFYSILLYFNMNFQKEREIELLKDDKILTYLYKKLIIFHNLFKNLILNIDIMRNLIKKAKTFDEILGLLPYIGNDIIQFLKLIHFEFDFIINIYYKEIEELNVENENKDKINEKDMKKIDIEKFVKPKKSDNIEKVYEVVTLIFSDENIHKIKIIKFSVNFIGKYIGLYYEKNIYNLQLMNSIIKLIKKYDKDFDFKYNDKDMNDIIHNTGIELIKRKQIKNKEILDFIKSDTYFISKEFDKKFYRPLEVLDGIDIETLDENFFIAWEAIDFDNIFGSYKKEFYDKILSLIKNMKDFGLLFKFFLYNNQKKYENETLKKIKKKYMDLFSTYIIEKCPKFEDDTIKLISIIDEYKIEIKDLLENIQNNLDYIKVNEIYIKLSNDNKKLRNTTKNLIATYFTTNKNNLNPSILIYLIINCKNFRKEIFSKINKYTLAENDFLSLEETDNYKLYKGLIDNKLIDKYNQYEGDNYITKIELTISALDQNIKNFEVRYNEISIFFENEQNKNILKERLKYLNTLDEKKAEQDLNNLEKKVKEINNKIIEFELILSDFRDFYRRKHSKDINNLTDICLKLKQNNLNYFEKNLNNDYNNYSKYLKDAQRRKNLKRSTFYNEIFQHYKNITNNNEDKVLVETEKTFDKIKLIFEKNGICEIDENIMEKCLKPFNENEEKLKNELTILSQIYNVNNPIENLYEEILLFAKRKFIFITAFSIKIFIGNINPKNTNFMNEINDIIIKINQNKDIETIKICNNKLKELKIFDGNEKNNRLIKILIKFKEHPDSILYLLNKTNQDLNNLQEIASLNENGIVIINDILDMAKCIDFFKKIGTLEEIQKMSDNELIEKMDTNVKENKYIDIYFENYINSYDQIRILEITVDRSEFLKSKILELFNGCEFLLSNSKQELNDSKEILFKCSYRKKIKEELHEVNLSKNEIISLRDRALLAKTIIIEYKYFIESITEIINISNILNELYIKGYPKIIEIKIKYKIEIVIREGDGKKEINPKIECDIDNIQKNDFKDIILELKNILQELEQKQLNAYKTKTLIRYLYGRQFNLLYDSLQGNKINRLEALLKYITNDTYKKKLENFQILKEGNLIEKNIQDWNNYLDKILIDNELTLEHIYKPTIIKKNILNDSGIFTHVCSQLEKNIFHIYKFLTGNYPIAQNILLCNKDTSNEEITAFLYRSILCEFNSCFIIAGFESVETEKKSKILDILNNFFPKGDEKIKSCLFFLFQSNNSDIYKSLERKTFRKILDIREADYGVIKYEQNDIEIIKSDKSGVGKSKQIQLEIEKINKKRIYFPIGGAFTKESLISRLIELKIDDNCVLHIDLYDSDKRRLMKDFLFSILITRFYGKNEDIFFLSKNIQIKVEIPNTFINFFYLQLNLF